MGAAAATAKQPLAEVDIKNEIGVLYGEEARQASRGASRPTRCHSCLPFRSV